MSNMKHSIDIKDARLECPFCKEKFADKTILADHSVVCDLNPEVQSMLNDLLGLTFKTDGLLIRIMEVTPGIDKPLKAIVLSYETDTENDNVFASIQTAHLHYRNVCGKEFGKEKEFKEVAQAIKNEIDRSMI